jgi:hypothetical protein
VTKLKALEALPIATKADQLRTVWAQVEQKLAGGSSHAAVLRALNEDGFNLTERTYKSYVYRFRKKQRKAGKSAALHSPQLVSPQPAPAGSSTAAAPEPRSASKRPRTFDYDPRGIPDLLK